MNPNRIFYRKTRGLDNGVWILIIVMMVLSLGLFSFFLVRHTECIPFSIIISPDSDSANYTGKTLYFDVSSAARNRDITWDFGDSAMSETGIHVPHQFTRAGKFFITASLSSECNVVREIMIVKDPRDNNSVGTILAPANIEVGKVAEFTCLKYAKSFEWRVMNHDGIKSTITPANGKVARFIFPAGGPYTIQVKLDGEVGERLVKDIFVSGGYVPKTVTQPAHTIVIPKGLQQQQQKPPQVVTEQPAKRQIFPVTEGNFKDKLKDVLADNAQKLSLEDFNDYLEDGGDTKVMLIPSGKPMNFSQFYKYIKGMQNDFRIDKVEFKQTGTKIYLIRVTLVPI